MYSSGAGPCWLNESVQGEPSFLLSTPSRGVSSSLTKHPFPCRQLTSDPFGHQPPNSGAA